MTTLAHTIESLWQVLAIGLLFGTGVPIVVAFGIRCLGATEDAEATGAAVTGAGSTGAGSTGAGSTGAELITVRGPARTAAGYACFALAVVAVLLGIAWIMKDFLATDLGIHIF